MREKKHIRTLIIICIATIFVNCDTSPSGVDERGPKLSAQIIDPIYSVSSGLSKLGFSLFEDGFLYVPEKYSPDIAMPLVFVLHGASGSSNNWIKYYNFDDFAEEKGFILAAINSKYYTWDLILGGYGEDVSSINSALQYIFLHCKIVPDRIALCGFSDGATYTLSLVISNGDIFTHLMAFSPGFVTISDPLIGKPKIFVAHGNSDYELPVEGSRDYIVPNFIDMGYDVKYYKFRGGHQVSSAASNNALDWFISD